MTYLPLVPYNFLALPDHLSRLETAGVVVLPVPYDSTTSFRPGARNGPLAIIEASYNLEDYDPELETDLSQVGIHTAHAIEPHMGGPQQMVERVRTAASSFIQRGRLLAVLGGEHSISSGVVAAHLDLYPDLSVLFLDAHGDFRDQYMDTPWGHASVALRIHEQCPVTLVGTRSLCQEEHQRLRADGVPTFGWPPHRPLAEQIADIVELLSDHVYVSIDLDVLDPSIMSAVGTPEPGGMDWHQATTLLRAVAASKEIVGFDVVELSPGEGPTACAYTAAKLAYKMMGYSLRLGNSPETSLLNAVRGQA